nr:kinesin-like protein KIN-7D, mitochondrial isoform X1 [Ipomoea batatas]GMD80398.1 kinesin-like protein KIN-7D, mitochondrial isoform X1 [Ipomoea batatas]
MTPSRNRSGSANPKSYGSRTPVHYPSADELLAEPLDASRSGESISVTVRFRPMSEREYQRGDENAWYPDGDKVVRNEYNPAIAYAFDRVFGQDTSTQEVYEVAARPVVKAAMEGINESTEMMEGVDLTLISQITERVIGAAVSELHDQSPEAGRFFLEARILLQDLIVILRNLVQPIEQITILRSKRKNLGPKLI